MAQSKFKKKEKSIITRLGIEHKKLTHEYLMAKDTPPICKPCGITQLNTYYWSVADIATT